METEITYVIENGVPKEVVKNEIDVSKKLAELNDKIASKINEKTELEGQIRLLQEQVDSVNSL